MKPLNKNNAYRKKGLNKIKSQYCKTRQVNCCPEIRNKTEESSNVLSPCSKIESNPESGCWIPNASKGKEFCNRSCHRFKQKVMLRPKDHHSMKEYPI